MEPGKNTGVGCRSLLQGIFLTQGLNTGLLRWRQILYHLSHQGSLAYIDHLCFTYLFIWLHTGSLCHAGSVVVVCRLSSCGAACRLLVSWPGKEPWSSVLQGRFLTTGPPEKSLPFILYISHHLKKNMPITAKWRNIWIYAWMRTFWEKNIPSWRASDVDTVNNWGF